MAKSTSSAAVYASFDALNPQEVWSQCLEHLRKNVHAQSVKTWLQPVTAVDFQQRNLTLSVPSAFHFEWLESHYADKIKATLKSIYNAEIKLTFTIAERANELSNSRFTVPVNSMAKAQSSDFESQLNQRYTFDNFIEGDGNQFAKAAALAVSEAPGQTAFNPLFIFGGTGLGKTHLIQAIGNFSLEENRSRRVLYVNSEQFTSDFINAIRQHKTADFSNYYRSIDLLLIDDVQFFSNKGKTQEEFFHTFNALHQTGKQIVMTSDRRPSELKDLEDRLLSRFQWGLVVDIQPPDFETRMAILQRRCELDGVNLDAEILEYLAMNVTSNVRELEGALIRILAQASLTGAPLNMGTAKAVVKDIGKRREKKITIERIMQESARYFGIKEDLIREKTRKGEIVEARQVAMYLSKILTQNSVKTIGLHFGGRDHSTVVHSYQQVEKNIKSNKPFAEKVEDIRRILAGN
jgi:chromosomal replication initiator protein